MLISLLSFGNFWADQGDQREANVMAEGGGKITTFFFISSKLHGTLHKAPSALSKITPHVLFPLPRHRMLEAHHRPFISPTSPEPHTVNSLSVGYSLSLEYPSPYFKIILSFRAAQLKRQLLLATISETMCQGLSYTVYCFESVPFESCLLIWQCVYLKLGSVHCWGCCVTSPFSGSLWPLHSLTSRHKSLYYHLFYPASQLVTVRHVCLLPSDPTGHTCVQIKHIIYLQIGDFFSSFLSYPRLLTVTRFQKG